MRVPMLLLSLLLQVDVPVIGGHAGTTILPILSQSRPDVLPALGDDAASKLVTRIQNAGTEVVDAKAGGGSATLSMVRVSVQPLYSVVLKHGCLCVAAAQHARCAAASELTPQRRLTGDEYVRCVRRRTPPSRSPRRA